MRIATPPPQLPGGVSRQASNTPILARPGGMQVTVQANMGQHIAAIQYIDVGLRHHNSTSAKIIGKRMAHFLMKYTAPTGKGTDAIPMGPMKSRIREDVGFAYAVKGDPNWEYAAYGLIENSYGKDKANEWYHDFKSRTQTNIDPNNPGKLDAEEKFDKMRKIPRKVDERAYNTIRRSGGDWRYPALSKGKAHPWLGIVSRDKREKLIKSRNKTIGLAKAGWLACFRLIGGRGFQGGKAGYGKQANWPKELKVPYALFGGTALGSVKGGVTKDGCKVTMTSNVRYADDALIPGAESRVLRLTESYMKMLFALRTKNMQKALNSRTQGKLGGYTISGLP